MHLEIEAVPTPPPAHALGGRTIIVTRPATQADTLCAAIEAAGGRAWRLPLLDIIPQHDAAYYAPFAARLDTYAQVFFVSANAVAIGLAGLRQHRPWPPGPPVVTVGPGSARALHEAGFPDVALPASQFDSEGVLDLPAFNRATIEGRHVLIVRGGGGRTLLADTLRERGAQIDQLDCYLRVPAHIDVPALMAAHTQTPFAAIALTSSEATLHFVDALRRAGADSLLEQLIAFAPHARIADNAKAAGFSHVILTDGSDAGLLNGMSAYFGVSP